MAARKKSLIALGESLAAQKALGRVTAIFDTETTGLLKPQVADLAQQPKIIEFALSIIDDDYNVLSEHEWLIHPGELITPEITKITGITDDKLRGKPSFIEVLPEIQRALRGVDRIIAHNLPFDMGMLVNELKRIGREYAFPYPPEQVCTVQLASDLIFGRRARMIELYEKTTGRKLDQKHRALDDVHALLEIVRVQRW
jgi:DNA polymerase III epsilon subunit family exonuclease